MMKNQFLLIFIMNIIYKKKIYHNIIKGNYLDKDVNKAMS